MKNWRINEVFEETLPYSRQSTKTSGPSVYGGITLWTDLADGHVVERETYTPTTDLPSGYSMQRIRYISGGAGIRAYLIIPDASGTHRSIIFCRGGIDDAYTDSELTDVVAEICNDTGNKRTYFGIAIEYNGEGGSTGDQQVGGTDVDAVVDSLAVLSNETKASTTNVAMFGTSRGAVNTYRSLAQATLGDVVDAVSVRSGLTDLADENLTSTVTDQFINRVPGYTGSETAALEAVSPIDQVGDVPSSIPVRMFHGALDATVPVEQAQAMDTALTSNGNTVSYTELPNQGHNFDAGALSTMISETQTWFNTHVA